MPPDEFAELRFDPSGTLTILMGTQSSGQGHQTAYAQLAAERLGLAARQNPGIAGRHRGDRLWPRHRRLALVAGRRCGARSMPPAKADRQGPPHRRASVGGGRGGSRLCRRRLPHIRHRPRDRHRGGGARGVQPGCAARRCRARFCRERPFHPALADLSQWLPCLRGRDRARDRDMSILCAIWSSTISARSSTRCCCRARCRAGSRREWDRRCSNIASSTPRPASW